MRFTEPHKKFLFIGACNRLLKALHRVCLDTFHNIRLHFSTVVLSNSMISTSKSLRLICRLGAKFGGIPFEWSEENAELRLVNSRFKLWKWYLAIFMMGLNSIFVVFRCVQATCCMYVSYGKWFITIFSAVTTTSCSVLNTGIFIHHHEIITTVNQVWKINERIFKHNERQVEARRGVYFQQTSPVLFYFFYAYAFLQFFSAIVNVDTPKYVFSLFNLKKTPKWKLIPVGLTDMCLIVSGASTCSFAIVLFLTYVQSTKDSLIFLRKGKLSDYEFLEYYRILQQLNNIYTSCGRYFINTCMFGTTMVAYIISSFVVLKLHGEIHGIAIFAFGTIVAMTTLLVRNCFHDSYRIRKYSHELIGSRTARLGNGKYVKKVLLSLRPLGMHVADYFIVNQSTTFTFIHLAISNTITLVVLF